MKKLINNTNILQIPDPPVATYKNPFNDKPWYKRLFSKIYRLCELTILFIPFCWLSVVLFMFPDVEFIKTWWYDLLVITFKHAGPTFGKFAQWISMREDKYPKEFCEAMGTLRQNIETHSMRPRRTI
eukprot:UN32229